MVMIRSYSCVRGGEKGRTVANVVVDTAVIRQECHHIVLRYVFRARSLRVDKWVKVDIAVEVYDRPVQRSEKGRALTWSEDILDYRKSCTTHG